MWTKRQKSEAGVGMKRKLAEAIISLPITADKHYFINLAYQKKEPHYLRLYTNFSLLQGFLFYAHPR